MVTKTFDQPNELTNKFENTKAIRQTSQATTTLFQSVITFIERVKTWAETVSAPRKTGLGASVEGQQTSASCPPDEQSLNSVWDDFITNLNLSTESVIF